MKRKHAGASGEQLHSNVQHTDAKRHIHDLPDEVLGLVFAKLSCRDFWNVLATCRRWRERFPEALEERLWKTRCNLYGVRSQENTVIGRDSQHLNELIAREQDSKKRAEMYRSYFMKWQDYSLSWNRFCPVSFLNVMWIRRDVLVGFMSERGLSAYVDDICSVKTFSGDNPSNYVAVEHVLALVTLSTELDQFFSISDALRLFLLVNREE